MADAICSSSPLLSHYTAPKPCFVFPSVSFQNSIHTKRITKKRPPLHFTCLCAHNFHVISTHEHSDGSFVFRFGDPSEVVKNNQLEEANLEVDGEGSDEFSVVIITESDHRREEMVKNIQGEETSEHSVDDTNPVVGSESRRVSEIETSSGETSSSSSSLDIFYSIEITEQVDDVLHTRGSIELNHSDGFDEDDFVHYERIIELNGSSESVTQVENVVSGGECLVEIDGYESQASPRPKNQGASAETVGRLSNKNEELISLELNHVVEVARDDDHVKETLINNDGYESEASLSLSVFEHGFGLNDHESAAEITEPLTIRNQELVPAKLDPVIEVPVHDDGKRTSQQNIEGAHVSNNVDAKNVEAGTQNNSTGDSNNTEIIAMASLSSPLEIEPALHKEGNAKNVEAGCQVKKSGGSIMEGISENEVIGTVPLSLPLVAEPVLGEEGDAKSEEIKIQDDVNGGSFEREVIEALQVSMSFGAEQVLDEEGGDTTEKVGTQNVITRNGIKTLPLSLPTEEEPFLDEGSVKVEELGTQNDIMRVSSETEVIGMLPLSPPLEVQPFISEEGDAKSEEIKAQDDAQGGFCGKEVIGVLPVSMAFGAEPLLYEGDGSTTVEVGSHNDITGSHSESEDIGRMPVSLPSEAEPVLDEGGVKVVEVGTQNEIMTVRSETEVIGKLPLSPPLEAEPFFCEEGDAKKVEGVTENDIKGGSSESKVILTLPVPPPLEVQPIRDNEAEIGRTEILDESFRRGTVIMTNTSSEIMEVEVNKQSAAIDEPVDSSDSDKTVSKPIITDLQSKKMEKLFLSSGTASFPHPEKALAGGEDAYFTYQNWLGVADGVSQWSLEGVDLGKYAHEVMEIARELVSNCCDSPVTSPEEVLNLAVDRAHYTGSSTVLISHFDGQDLHVANIGDSGIIILRNDAVCQRSSPMYHEYNFPVLIQKEDGSKLVEQYTFNLDEGDVVVAATDGLFDNLYEEDIISIVSKSLEANINPKEIAETLAMRAQEVGASTCTRSPFSDEAQAAGYTGCTGGKLDDVVVVVSLVKKRSDFQPS